jgi:branched-chain amino acid transport system ATP-binding protein
MSGGLEIDGVTVRLASGPALQEISLAVAPGEIVALVGANGAGKSTLLRAVMGYLPPAVGSIRFAGQDLAGVPVERRARLGIGYAPEGRRMFPGLTVRETVEVACLGSRRHRAARIGELEALFPALAANARRRAWQLSGGQQQMLALARALAPRPRLLLLDEPSLGLAPRAAQEVVDHLRAIAGAGTAILLAEQNAALALDVADRAVLLRLGRVAAAGPAAALRDDPALAETMLGA